MPTTVTFAGYDKLTNQFKSLANWSKSADFQAMLARSGGIMAQDYLARLLTGTTAAGSAVADSSGIKARRRGRYRGAAGGPQAPFGRQSRAWTGYRWHWTSSGNVHTFADRIDGPAWITARVKQYRYPGVSPQARAKLTAHLKASLVRVVGLRTT